MFDKFLQNLSDKLEIIDSKAMATGHINSPASLAGVFSIKTAPA
jgi:hypothetical protein